jgi:hypothetical protein
VEPVVLVGLEEMLQTEQLARPELLEIQVDQAIPVIMGLQELAVLVVQLGHLVVLEEQAIPVTMELLV